MTIPIEVGSRFGRLTVMSQSESAIGPGRRRYSRWACVCDCGKVHTVAGAKLRAGATKSCGCWAMEAIGARSRTHGLYGTAMQRIWSGMKARCYNRRSAGYANYGGRGIFVCDEWRNDLPRFCADMGPRPTPHHSIERVDNDGPYSPSNCVWAPPEIQAVNKRTTVTYLYRGEHLTLPEIGRRAGVHYTTIKNRLKAGYSLEQATDPTFDFRAAGHRLRQHGSRRPSAPAEGP